MIINNLLQMYMPSIDAGTNYWRYIKSVTFKSSKRDIQFNTPFILSRRSFA